ncbi:MAG: hypothetical protein HUU14_08970 [Dehalococcoidia bacterium]|nr:hypothetical protein [Dehalococcoidia bacterium]
MARGIPRPDEPEKHPRRRVPGWVSWEKYQVVHQHYMQLLYDEGVVSDDTLSFVETVESGEIVQVRLEGEVVCASGVRVRVLKWLAAERRTRNRIYVRTTFYQYHAWRLPAAGQPPAQSILRYDQAHGSGLHRHHFDPAGKQVRHVEVSPDAMPTLEEVIREANELGSTTPDSRHM